jgi:hypothetical protein
MAKQYIPPTSRELITLLDKRYPDILDTEDSLSPFERGKVAGVVQLLRELKQQLSKDII